jgi:hypothetical protein
METPTVYQQILKEAGDLERDGNEAVKAGILSRKAADEVLRDAIALLVQHNIAEMQQRNRDHEMVERQRHAVGSIIKPS